ncbi:MAG: hypothetical protein ED557_09970 [Balneola sp.]|nr:MAG: hypothetical protein ED557_09970 [Balneola sp.]
MPAFSVSRSITINSSIDTVFNTLHNFNEWVAWSPWLIMEPEANVTISEDARYYEWEGNRVGSGNMKVTGELVNDTIFYDLTFLKPWKSEAKVNFKFKKTEENETEVIWNMDSSLPWFMFWMKKMMMAFIGMDYERGLRMLKEHIEDGEVKSKLEFKGVSDFPGSKYIGIKTTCGIHEMGEVMQADFGKIEAFMQEHSDIATGQAFSIYHKFDMVKQKASYTGCVGVTTIPDNLPGDFISGEIPATRAYTLRHIGAYDHLGNAWSTMQGMIRGKEIDYKKGFHPFEHYVTNPKETEEKDHITDVIFAVK